MKSMGTQNRNARITSDASVAANVRRYCAEQGISGRELARRLGTTAPYVARRLAGEVEFSATDLQRVSDALGVQVSALFGEPTA